MDQQVDTGADTQNLELLNVSLVQKFFADWSQRDARLLATYLADDFRYQMIEGEPDLVGPARFVELLGDVLPSFNSIDMQIRRITGYGQLVVVDRYDQMIGKDEARSMSFEVVASLVVYDGKIAALRDYPIRGGIFELGEAFQVEVDEYEPDKPAAT